MDAEQIVAVVGSHPQNENILESDRHCGRFPTLVGHADPRSGSNLSILIFALRTLRVMHRIVEQLGLKALILTALACFPSLASAQDLGGLLGTLGEALKPEVAEKLELTEDQMDQLRNLRGSRLRSVMQLGRQLREVSGADAEELRREFSLQSSELAKRVLSPEQYSKLEFAAVKSSGMMSLVNPQIADQLKLDDQQKLAVAEWASKMRAARRSPDEAKVRDQAERALRNELTDSQWTKWQQLAGEIKDAPEPQPPVREPEPAEETAADDAPEADTSDDASSDEASPSDSMATTGSRPGAMAAAQRPPAEIPVEDIRLTLNFNNAPWKDVIGWLAEQADLSLQNDLIPPGSFSYRDLAKEYTVTETLDVINASLLDKGYTLFRQGRMLRSIDFETQELAGEIISELADLVDENELAKRGSYEPVKFLFTLKRLDPEELLEEVEELLSIQGKAVALPLVGQMQVTDMAANVRAIATMIERAEDPKTARGSSIRSWKLDHITAEEVLAVARPHLGLEEDSNVSDEITISTTAFGGTIYAKGSADKIQDLDDLVTQMDVEPTDLEDNVDQVEVPELRRHQVVGIELQLAYDVVSQLLAGSPGVRLATNEVSKQLILMARPEEHKMVEEALGSLAGEISGFEVIQLEAMETLMAVETVKKFFNIGDEASAESGAPVIDGDISARQLWVKGTDTQIKQIKDLLKTLEANATENDLDGIKLYPGLKPSTLEQVKSLWELRNGGANPIRQVGPSRAGAGSALPQRRVSPPATQRRPVPDAQDDMQDSAPQPAPARSGDSAAWANAPVGRLVTAQDAASENVADAVETETATDSEMQAAEPVDGSIIIMEGPNGLIVSSQDPKVLAEFDRLMRLVADQELIAPSGPTIFYVVNIKATAAKELLETILSGSASSGGGGDLLGGMAGAMLGGGFGALLGGGGGGGGDLLGGDSGIASGDYSITADPRLNCLVVKASPADMQLIEQLLQIIDQVESPFANESKGVVKMIPVISQDVDQVLSIIKSLYGEQIEGAAPSGGAAGGRGGQPDPAAIIQALRGGGRGGRGGGGTSTELTEPKISITADTNTNMLIVLAQPSQIAEIEDLVKQIDFFGEAEEETISTTTLGGFKSIIYEDAVRRVLGEQVQTNSTPSESGSSSSSSSSSTSGAPGSSAADQARRAAFIEAMRSRFGGGGGGPGGRGGATAGATGGRGGAAFGGRGGGGAGGGGPGGGGGRGGRGGGR